MSVNPSYDYVKYNVLNLMSNVKTIRPDILVSPNYRYVTYNSSNLNGGADGDAYRGGIFGPKGYAGGGVVRGGSQLIEVAEEGTPEMIIPLGNHRRGRGMELWEKAGHMLGVKGFAQGGYVGGAPLVSAVKPIDRSPIQVGGTEGGSAVKIDLGGINVTIKVEGNADNMESVLRDKASDIAEMVVDAIAEGLQEQFENTPKRGATA